MLAGDKQIQPEFVDFKNLPQGFNFASGEATSDAREF